MPRPVFLEFDSTYRNRTRFPTPGDFIMPLSQTGREGKEFALDPISDGAAEMEWTSAQFSSSGLSREVLSGVVENTSEIKEASGRSTIILEIDTTSKTVQQADDYYHGSVFVDTTTATRHRITSSKYLGTFTANREQMMVTLDPELPATYALGNSFTITDPTDMSPGGVNPRIFVPSGSYQDHAYPSHILYNETRDDFRRITNYNGTTHLLTIDTSTPVPTWTVGDSFSIRRAAPIVVSTIGASTTTTLTLPSADPNRNYVGDFVRVRSTAYGNAGSSIYRRIISYSSNIATVSPPFTIPPTGKAEILQFTEDNLNPFVYSGSTVSQQEMTCYELELLNLVLPNTVLNVGSGGRIAFYPYVYLEISNETAAGAGTKHSIYSNNPHSTRAVFRVSVDDVPNPVFSSYVRIDGGGMVQTLKFKPNDNLRIKVTLPRGEVFDTRVAERFSPLRPNPSIQVSGVISMRRTENSHGENVHTNRSYPQQPPNSSYKLLQHTQSTNRFA